LAPDAGESGDDSGKIDTAYGLIYKKSRYTEEQIDNALRVVVYGEKAVKGDDTYKNITDIPDNLLRPCIRAIASEEGANIEIRGEF